MICSAKNRKRKSQPITYSTKVDTQTTPISNIVSAKLCCENNDYKPSCSSRNYDEPEKFMRLYGNRQVWQTIKDTIMKRNTIAVLQGPIGCGKTCGIRIIAHSLKLQIIEIDGSCDFTDFETDIKIAASRKSIGGETVIILEDINGWTSDNIKKLHNICVCKLKDCCSIICTCDDIYVPILKNIREVVYHYKLFPLDCDNIFSMVKFHIPDVRPFKIQKLMGECNQDVRQMIMRCKGVESALLDSGTPNIFKATEQILYKHKEAEKAIETFSDYIITSMIFKNYPNAVQDWIGPFSSTNIHDALADVAESISCSDIMRHGSLCERTQESMLLLNMLPHRIKCKPEHILFELIPFIKRFTKFEDEFETLK